MLPQKSPKTGYWKNGDLKFEDVLFRFSRETQKELRDWIKALPAEKFIEDIKLSDYSAPNFQKDMEKVREELETGTRLTILAPVEGLNPLEQGVVSWLAGIALGNPLNQASDPTGKQQMKIYRIFDRGGRLEKGARYSYTNQGGDCHTDNVNTDDSWQYMILTSVFSAYAGGGSILVSGLTVHDILEEQYPEVLETLRQPILWERKGIRDNTFYEAPVVTYNEKGEPEFRWLPSYVFQSIDKAVQMGHPKAQPMTAEQKHAFDVMTATLARADLQFQSDLPEGHALIDYDCQVFHERGHFADRKNPYIPDVNERTFDPSKNYGRLRYRMWIKK